MKELVPERTHPTVFSCDGSRLNDAVVLFTDFVSIKICSLKQNHIL